MPVQSVSWIRFKFRSQFKLLPQIRCLIAILQITSSGRSLIHSRKSVETPALTGYSCEDFSSRTTWSYLLLRKDEIRPNIWPETPKDLSLWSRPACQTLSKALDISNASASVAPDVLKALALLSDTTMKRSVVDQEDLKTYWKSQNRPHFSRWTTILLLTSFSKTLLTIERRLTGQ